MDMRVKSLTRGVHRGQDPDSLQLLKVPQIKRILQHVRKKRNRSHIGIFDPRCARHARVAARWS
jgi:hypothetical protein